MLHKYKQHTTRVCFLLCGIMMLYLIQFRFKAVHSEEQCVILQVLAVLVNFVYEILVTGELTNSPASCSSFSLSDTSTTFFSYIMIMRPRFPCEMLSILQLIEQADFDGSFEGPMQMVVIVSSHQIDKHRHMSAFTVTKSISIHTEVHLVPSKVRVHRITEP